MQHKVLVKVHLVTSAQDQADQYTRLGLDRGDYTLNMELFLFLKQEMLPQTSLADIWDMFASPGNCKTPNFCARHPHWQAKLVDALTCLLNQVRVCYANPPWN